MDVVTHRLAGRDPIRPLVAAVAEPDRLADHHMRTEPVDQGGRSLDPQPTSRVDAYGFVTTGLARFTVGSHK
jgi:hypothetical protein